MSPLSTKDGLDIYNLKEKYGKEKEKVKDWIATEENKKLFLGFLDRRESEGIGIVQRIKYIDSVKTFVQFNGKDFFSFTEKDLQDFILSMTALSPKTRHIKWYCIKKFFEFLGKDELYKNFKPKFGKKKNETSRRASDAGRSKPDDTESKFYKRQGFDCSFV